MSRRVLKQYRIRVKSISCQIAPQPPTPVDPPVDPDLQLQRLRYEADQARADSERIRRELEEIKRQLPSDEQRARWAELESQHQSAEEKRRRAEGEFDAWKAQIQVEHERELGALRQESANERARAEATERELNDTLIGLAFSGAAEWFGPAGKTIFQPDMARTYLGGHVMVEVVPGMNGAPSKRRVVVKDAHGTVILDTKTGQPAPFAQAIGEVIETHPQKQWMLKGSGKVGSGSAGGDHQIEGRDLTRLRPQDFKDPRVRDAVRQQQEQSGGMQIGPGFDRINQARRKPQ